jgi:hypothetical protein
MSHRPLRRAAVLSLGALLAFAGTAAADSVLADGDTLTPIVDGTRHLGDVSPGDTVSADVRFVVVCAALQHVDANQSVVLGWSGGGTVPLGGAVQSVTQATLSPLTVAWATDAQGCPDPVPSYEGGVLSRVTLRAPTTAGIHRFTIVWDRSLQPLGNRDADAFSRTPTTVDFTMRVVANSPPTLTVPASFTVEGDTTGGWTAAWTVSATDVEDSPDPTPTCSPAAGSVLPLGTTTISCSVTDSAGASDNDTFDVTVVDTTAPVLTGMPGDLTVSTGDPAGTAVDFDDPTANDVVDPSPDVACTPASGSSFSVGSTQVTCTATDASGNASSDSFDVTVTFVAPHAANATWLEPVAGGSTYEANRGRTIPIKVRLFVDGFERSSGEAVLTVTPCGGGTVVELPLSWGGGRWNVSLDTLPLAGDCHTVGASIDGLPAGSFTLQLRGAEAAKTAPKPSVTSRGVERPRSGHVANDCRRPR